MSTPGHAQAARAQSRRPRSPHPRYHDHETREARSPSATGFSGRSPASNGRCRGAGPEASRCFPRTLTNAGRRQAGQQHLPGHAPGRLAARSSITTRSLACARVTAAPRPPRSLAVDSRPIRDLRPPGPAGQTLLARRRGTRSCGLALRRSCAGLLPTRRLRRSGPARPPGDLARARS